MKSIKDLRTDYQKSELNVKDLTVEPITLFQQWLSQAITYSNDANAFVLSTVNSNSVPSSRVLLLRMPQKKDLVFSPIILVESRKRLRLILMFV